MNKPTKATSVYRVAALVKKANHLHKPKHSLRVGLFGIGLAAYWPQFKGLKKRIEAYLDIVHQKLSRPGVKVVNLGLVDTPQKALEAGHAFRRQDVDLLFLHITTYALSSTVLPVVQRAKVPVIVLNLQPEAAIDYGSFNRMRDRTAMTGEWLAHCTACPAPEIANVFNRAGIQYHQVTGTLEGESAEAGRAFPGGPWTEIDEWIEAAHAANVMFHNRLGLMGRYYCGMLDIYSDLTQHCATFGGHMELVEVDELTSLRRDVTNARMKERLAEFQKKFDIQSDCARRDLEDAARTSIALDKFVEIHALGSMAYYYDGSWNAENRKTISSIILGNSMLTARGIPVAAEYEVKNAQAMKIIDSFGAGGSFTEYYAMDFKDDVVLMGHDGPGHIGIAEGKTKVRPLRVYHGKVGEGLSVEMSVRHGPVTLLSVVQTMDGNLKFLVAEGESVAGPILEIGNTNSRYRFSIGARRFVENWNRQGPAHHCAVGIGHIAPKLEKLAALLRVECVKVCQAATSDLEIYPPRT